MKKELQSKDLRIGNLVIRKESGVKTIIKSINENSVRTNIGTLPYNLLLPVPLTELTLEMLGFDKSQDLLVRGLIMRYSFSNKIIELIRYETLIDFKIEYVHELQNLYFALTGEELELKNESKP
jgi:hypothetical protein